MVEIAGWGVLPLHLKASRVRRARKVFLLGGKRSSRSRLKRGLSPLPATSGRPNYASSYLVGRIGIGQGSENIRR